MVSATVNNSSAAVASASPNGRWLFTNISPITLPAGTYTLGFFSPLSYIFSLTIYLSGLGATDIQVPASLPIPERPFGKFAGYARTYVERRNQTVLAVKN